MTNQIQEGVVNLVLPGGLEVPAKAGTMSDGDVRSLPKCRAGLGVSCQYAASEMEKMGPEFTVPGVTAAELRAAGEQADLWDEVIEDTELALRVAKQANLLADNDAFTMLRKVNNQVKAQAAFNPKIKERFTAVTEYFSSARKTATTATDKIETSK
jgi:hypothetical protein